MAALSRDLSALRVIIAKCIASVDPGTLIKSALRKKADSNVLMIRDLSLTLSKNCYVIGFGKAVYKMAIELEKILGSDLQEGIISIPKGSSITQTSQLKSNSKIRIFEGAENNLPDENAYEAAINVKSLVESRSRDDVLFVLISGGGSALLPYPIPPLTLAEKHATIKLLSLAGADIAQVNTVRKALSNLKGGKLARLAYPTTTVALILSDVVGDPLDIIAAGPTVISPVNEREEAITVLNRLNLRRSVPENVNRVLCKPDEIVHQSNDPASLRLHNIIIGNNAAALAAAKTQAERAGYIPIVISSRLTGSVADLSQMYADLAACILGHLKLDSSKVDLMENLKRLRDNCSSVGGVEDVVEVVAKHADTIRTCGGRRLVLIGGGEPTVLVKGDGLGGRNQELALEMAIRMRDLKLKNGALMSAVDVVFASAGTDGIDGPTDAAGALTYLDMAEDAIAEFDLHATTYLRNNDSYRFFSKFRNGACHIKTGHTGTNVMDVHFLVIGAQPYDTVEEN